MELSDVLVDRDFGNAELTAVLAEALSIPPAAVLTVDDLEEAEPGGDTRLIIHRIPTRGEFVLLLSCYPRTEEIRNADGGRAVAFLSRKLQCRCLVSDGDVNPYSMLMYEGGEGPRKVFLKTGGLAKTPEEYTLENSE